MAEGPRKSYVKTTIIKGHCQLMQKEGEAEYSAMGKHPSLGKSFRP